MRDAAFFRARAELCREIARHTSSAEDAAWALNAAARHDASAQALENNERLGSKAVSAAVRILKNDSQRDQAFHSSSTD
jgi:hypothetical protein